MTDAPLSIADLEPWIERTLEAADAPGGAVYLERQGEPLLARGFGYRDVEAGLPADIDTVFGSGSVTKSLTALAILLLEEDGQLATSDLVTAHLADLRLPGADAARITLHHLLTHTAGLPPLPSRHYAWLSQDDLEPFERAAMARLPPRAPIHSFSDLVAFLSEHPFAPHAPPGERFSYSNEGYNLLGAVIERVSGQTLPEFVRDRVLAPTGMSRSSLDLAFTLGLDNVTRLHVRQEGRVQASANWFDPACWIAAGGLRTTAADLARFFRMLAQGGVIDGVRIAAPATVGRMTAACVSTRPSEWYGYGLTLCDVGGHTLAQHGGGHKGVSAMAGFAADEGLVCVVLTNLGGAPALQLWAGAMRAALGLPPGLLVEPGPTIELPLETRRSFCGVYRSPEGTDFTVSFDEAGGLLVTDGALSAPARPSAVDAITFTGPDGAEQTIRFVRVGGDAVTHAFAGWRLVKRREAAGE